MKRKTGRDFLIFTMLFFIFSGCSNSSKNEITTDMIPFPASAEGVDESMSAPKIEFEKTTHDFGTLKQGEKVSYTFKFKNTGKANLIVSAVVPSCGCTVAQFTRTPVKPGQEGFITISLDTKDKKGLLQKKAAVSANTYPGETVLHFSANVELP